MDLVNPGHDQEMNENSFTNFVFDYRVCLRADADASSVA
jgi:hypothetical protein